MKTNTIKMQNEMKKKKYKKNINENKIMLFYKQHYENTHFRSHTLGAGVGLVCNCLHTRSNFCFLKIML